MSLTSLRDLLPDVHAWQWHFQREYQIRTMLRMNDVLREQGLTQKDLAEQTGWSKSFVSRLLSPGGNVTLRTVARFEDAVGARVLTVTAPEAPAAPRMQRVVPAAPAVPYATGLDRSLHIEAALRSTGLLRPGQFATASLTTDE